MKTNTNEKQTQIFTLRLPSNLLNNIRKIAEDNKRSMAKEIEYRLEKSLTKE